MAINSYSPSNSSDSSPCHSSTGIVYCHLLSCFNSFGGINITAFTVTVVLIILPLCIAVLYLGLKRRREQRSTTTMSHSDLLAYHMVIIELVSIVGFGFVCCAVHTNLSQTFRVGINLYSINICGQMCFHVLTCAERYLAVTHPVTYLSLRSKKGIRLRNVSISCAWLLSIASVAHTYVENNVFIISLFLSALFLILVVVSFCSISVLRALIRPGPGDGGGSRQQVNTSKLRAFYIIMAIMGVLLFRFGGSIVATALYASPQAEVSRACGGLFVVLWSGLPSSLVLPLLFLQRVGKLPCRKSQDNDQSK